MAQISCEHLALGYEGRTVIEDLNFEVNAGDYLCIVGENGAGKSTLMKALLGLKAPTKGSVRYGDGLDKNGIGYLPQQTQVQKDFPATVEEIVRTGVLSRKDELPPPPPEFDPRAIRAREKIAKREKKDPEAAKKLAERYRLKEEKRAEKARETEARRAAAEQKKKDKARDRIRNAGKKDRKKAMKLAERYRTNEEARTEMLRDRKEFVSAIRPFYTRRQKAYAAAQMARMGITQFRRRCYRELSGGQQQRVLLARALCATEKMILLDEPVAGLDPRVTQEMYDLIEELNKDGITVIMVSHDIMAAVRYASHILHVSRAHMFFGTKEAYLRSEIGKTFTGAGGDHA